MLKLATIRRGLCIDEMKKKKLTSFPTLDQRALNGLRSCHIEGKIIIDVPFKIPRRSLLCYEHWLTLYESIRITLVFTLRLIVFIHIYIWLRCCFRVEVVKIFRWLDGCPIRFQHLFISFQFGMEAFPWGLVSFSFPAHRGDKAAFLLCLDTIGTGGAPVTPNLALPT